MCREVRRCGASASIVRLYRADELDKFETHDLETLAQELAKTKIFGRIIARNIPADA